MITDYIHHGTSVFVDENLKGKHREHCLCWKCGKFVPEDRDKNCQVANLLFAACCAFSITTPVWECPQWEPK